MSAFNCVNSRGIHIGMTENIRRTRQVLFERVTVSREQMPQIMLDFFGNSQSCVGRKTVRNLPLHYISECVFLCSDFYLIRFSCPCMCLYFLAISKTSFGLIIPQEVFLSVYVFIDSVQRRVRRGTPKPHPKVYL